MNIIDLLFSEDISDDKKIEMLENRLQIDFNEITDEILTQVREEFVIYRSGKLQSSNVRNVNYDSDKQIMTITFNNGSVYEYYEVPQLLYLRVRNGLSTPKTTGSNRYGSWSPQKFPSVGASLDRFVKKTSIRYKKIK